MNNVEKLKRVREALGMFRVSSNGDYICVVRCGKPELFNGMDGDIPFAYRHPKEGTVDTGDAKKADELREKALTIIDELIDQQSKGVDVLTEVEMVQVAGILFNAGHEELSKKAYSALKACQPKAPSVSEGELVAVLMNIPVQEAEYVECHLAIPSHYMDEITAKRFVRALSERGVITTEGEV